MPLVRVGVRNEYSLGAAELYGDADREDPKAVLDAVAVSGLVGILRQLGDLAEFAAEVFHGLQEQVMITSSRSHKLMARVQRIETALPSLEKSILSQQSHLHFAYTAGSNWHTRLHCEENHFIYSDLPRFIMDSYEECRGPPRLQLLDKFDPGGPGSCLKRYSDPTFFKRASAGSDEAYLEKVLKNKKGRKIKKKRSSRKFREVSHTVSSISNYGGRKESRKFDGQTNPSQRISTHSDATLKSGLGNGVLSQSFGSVYGSAQMDGFSCPSSLMQPDEDNKAKEEIFSSPIKSHNDDSLDYCFFDEKSNKNDVGIGLSQEQTDHISSSAERNGQRQSEEDDCRQSAYPVDKIGNVNGDISNGHSEEHNGVAWNGIREIEEDESRMSLHSNGSLEYPVTNEDNGDACVDIGNGLTEEDSGYILYSVSRDNSAGPLELDSKESLNSPSQKNQNDSIQFSSPDEKMWVISDETESDFSQKQAFFSPPCSTLDQKIDALETTSQKCDDDDDDENFETHSASVGADACITDAVSRDTVEQTELVLEKMDQKDSNDFASPDEKAWIVSDESGEEQASPSPSSSTLDKKMDTVEIIKQKCSNDENLAIHPEADAVTLDTIEQIDLLSENKNTQIQNYADVRFDEVDSETDNFVDALNTIESESESDLDCQTKKNSVPDSSLKTEVVAKHAEFPSSNLASEAGETPAENDTFGDYSGAVPSGVIHEDDALHRNASECNSNSESPQVSNGTQESGLQNSDLNEIHCVLDTPDVESVSVEKSSEIINKVSCPTEPPKPPPEPPAVTSVKFWTNGNLLGLEPSKPPVTALKPVTQDDVIGAPRQSNDHIEEKLAKTSCVTEDVSKDREESKHPKTSLRFSSVDLDESDAVPSGNLGQENVNNYNNNNSSSRILSLGNRLLGNGLQRKLSLGWENNSNSASSMTSGLADQKNQYENITSRTFSEKATDLSRSGSPMMSPSWSPPLGHMKISFQPVDGLETHKLKLRFPDKGTRLESSNDLFPSFQLVPEAALPLHDLSSDSDNDTFCRSSPSMSDDCLSKQSESDSEQWESGESSSAKDQEVYDALRRISLTESTSTSFDNRLTTQDEQSFYDLPVLDTLRSSVKQEPGNRSAITALVERQSSKELIPPPPPSIPPQEWQSLRSLSDMTDSRRDSLPKGLNFTVDKKLSATFSHQPKRPSLNQDPVAEPTFELKTKRLGFQQQNVATQAANGKETEEKKGFLQQIRTKSFSLRPTVTSKTNHTTGLPTSVNAILQKANAIRQAVGSDGEDSCWSDT